MKKSCKPGKTPTGKNGRCVKPKTIKSYIMKKSCKPGKTPTGKNGRCVKPKTLKMKKMSKKELEMIDRTGEIRRQIYNFMAAVGDDESFTDAEINKFVDISIKNNLSKSEIKEALENYSKDYGEFA